MRCGRRSGRLEPILGYLCFLALFADFWLDGQYDKSVG